MTTRSSRWQVTTNTQLLQVNSLLPPADEVVGRYCFHICVSVGPGVGGYHVTITMMHWTALYTDPQPPQTLDLMGLPC